MSTAIRNLFVTGTESEAGKQWADGFQEAQENNYEDGSCRCLIAALLVLAGRTLPAQEPLFGSDPMPRGATEAHSSPW